MTLPQILRVLWARRYTVLLWAALLFGAALAASLLLPKTYKASADVVIDLARQDELSQNAPQHEALAREVATQVDVIQSQRVASEVVTALRLDENPDMVANWRDATSGTGSIRDWIAGELLEDLAVRADSEGSFIRVSFKATDPQRAADVANAFVESYLSTALSIKADPAKRNVQIYTQRVEQSRQELVIAKARLAQYQQDNNVVNPSERFDAENERLTALSKELLDLETQAAEVRARRETGAGRSALPEVLANPVVQSLKQSVAQAEAEMNQLARQFGSNHPTMVASINQVRSLRAQLQGEINRQARSIEVAGQITTRKSEQIAAALAEQRKKVIALEQHKVKMDVMQQQVDAAEKAFKLASDNLTRSVLRSESGQTNASLLAPAAVPVQPDSPNLMINTIVGGLLGSLLGCFIALGREASRPQIRSVQDLIDGFDLPVLVSLPSGDGGAQGGGGGGRALPRLSHLGSSSAPRLENARS